MLNPADPRAETLLRFNRDVLDSALAVVDAYEATAPQRFAECAGPHLRHVIEHYEALIARAGGAIDYDARVRDPSIERSPAVARGRLQALKTLLGPGGTALLATPVTVRALIGLHGEHSLMTTSTMGRELLFLASHAVHHFAVMKLHARAHGVALADELGKAPATLAHQQSKEAA